MLSLNPSQTSFTKKLLLALMFKGFNHILYISVLRNTVNLNGHHWSCLEDISVYSALMPFCDVSAFNFEKLIILTNIENGVAIIFACE